MGTEVKRSSLNLGHKLTQGMFVLCSFQASAIYPAETITTSVVFQAPTLLALEQG